MNTMKLHEALAEIERDIERLEIDRQNRIRAAEGLRALLAAFREVPAAEAAVQFFAPDEKPSYIDEAEEFIREAGHPLHAKLLSEKISEKRGVKVARSSVESSLIRHGAKAKRPKVVKMGRSTFGLPEWKQPSLIEAPLAQTA